MFCYLCHSYGSPFQKNTNGLGLIHESQSIYDPSHYTRGWFAWANSYFAEMLLDLADRKPGLIFRDDTRYVAGKYYNTKWNYRNILRSA